MKHILVILLSIVSVTVYSQSPRIKLNQIVKDNAKGSILISSPTDSQMVYSRDFFINFGADTTLVLFGDTIGGGISTVVTDLVTIQGDGSVATPLYVDTSIINTIKGMVDTLTARGYLTTEVDGSTTNEIQTLSKVGQTVSLSLSGGSFTDDVLTETEVDAFVANNGYLTAEVDGSVTNEIQDISTDGSAGNITISSGSTLNLNVNDADASATNEGSLTVQSGGANDSQIQSNTSGSTNVTIAGGSNVTVTESGNTITIASTASGGGGTIPVDTFVTIAGTETITGAKTFSEGIVVDKSNQGEYFRGEASTGTNYLSISSSTLSLNGDKHTINASGTTGEIALASDGTEILTISSDDKVGIMNNGPGANLDVRATGSGNDNAFLVSGLVGQNLLEVDTDGDLIVDTSTLYVDATNNMVGIGTATPNTESVLAGDLFIKSVRGGYDAGLYIRKGVAGNNQNYKNIFIGEGFSSDASNIDNNVTMGMVQLTNADSNYANFNFFDKDYNNVGGFGMRYLSHTSNLTDFYIATANGGAPTTKMTIKGNGNVGIGTSSPSAKMQLKSSNFQSNTVDFSLLDNSNNERTSIASTGQQRWYLSSTTAEVGKIEYATPSSSPGIVLWTGSAYGTYTNRFNMVNTGTSFMLGYGTSTSNFNDFVIESDGGILMPYLLGSTSLTGLKQLYYNTTTKELSYDNTSSIKMKNNIMPYSRGLNDLLNVDVVEFNYKSDGTKDYGVIAEQLLEIGLDEFVYNNEDGEIQGVYKRHFTPLTIKAIQEQQAIIETQQSEIEQLKTLITDLTNRLIILENK